MPNHLTTVEGIFDGEAIRPLGRIKTRKRRRVLISFLAELDDIADLKAFGKSFKQTLEK